MPAQKTGTLEKFSAQKMGLLPSEQQRQLPKKTSMAGKTVSRKTKNVCDTESSTSSSSNSAVPAAGKNEEVCCCTDGKSNDCPGNEVLDCRMMEKSAPRPTCPPPMETAGNGWPQGRMVCDEIGSGIIPYCSYPVVLGKGTGLCCTPLTQYQMIHGEHARKILTNQICARRNILRPPPCNVCRTVIPLCRGYYREYKYKDDVCYADAVSSAKCNVSQSYWQQNWESFGVIEPSAARLAAHSSGLVDRILLAKPELRKYCTD